MGANVNVIVENEPIIFHSEDQYSDISKAKNKKLFNQMQYDKRIQSEYSDMKWKCFSGVKTFFIDFYVDKNQYRKHAYSVLRIPSDHLTDMLKCFVLHHCGDYIFPTLKLKIRQIKEYLEGYGSKSYTVSNSALEMICEFLTFINIPDKTIQETEQSIRLKKDMSAKPRTLSHLINYLALSNEIDDMYASPALSDEEYILWFPLYFWTKITFVIPLRATEMLVTPFDCIERSGHRIYLHLRRTQLKKRTTKVCYHVEDDYKEFIYEVPETDVIKAIEKYQLLTGEQERKYLFRHSKYMINNIVSLASFNLLLKEYISMYLIGNPKYDYARFASGIREFEYITAGDSRPIAMSNLYYQNFGADICRQIADHVNINTSANYFQNISNTLLCSAIMNTQRDIHKKKQSIDDMEAQLMEHISDTYEKRTQQSYCNSPHKPMVTGDITDCKGHYHECLGCMYYAPSIQELKAQLEKRRNDFEKANRSVLEYMQNPAMSQSHNLDFDKIFLDAHTTSTRYYTAATEKAKEKKLKWERIKNTI